MFFYETYAVKNLKNQIRAILECPNIVSNLIVFLCLTLRIASVKLQLFEIKLSHFKKKLLSEKKNTKIQYPQMLGKKNEKRKKK